MSKPRLPRVQSKREINRSRGKIHLLEEVDSMETLCGKYIWLPGWQRIEEQATCKMCLKIEEQAEW